MDTTKMISVGFDGGFGGLKMWSHAGGLEMLSQVATNGGGHFEGMIGLKPVSYTHLDVYKRQLHTVTQAARWMRPMIC